MEKRILLSVVVAGLLVLGFTGVVFADNIQLATAPPVEVNIHVDMSNCSPNTNGKDCSTTFNVYVTRKDDGSPVKVKNQGIVFTQDGKSAGRVSTNADGRATKVIKSTKGSHSGTISYSNTNKYSGDSIQTSWNCKIWRISATPISRSDGSISISPNKKGYNDGEKVTLTAIPKTNCKFNDWTLDSSTYTANPLILTMDADKVVVASFSKNAKQYTLTVGCVGSGSVTKSPDKSAYDEKEQVTLTAVPGAGYKFKTWSGDVSGPTNPVTLTMNNNKTVKATFEPILQPITVNLGSCPPVITRYEEYSCTPTASGGNGGPYTFFKPTGGNFPPMLIIISPSKISGKATSPPGWYPFQVCASDTEGNQGCSDFGITVGPCPSGTQDDFAQKKCVPNVVCPSGQHWDDVLKKCVNDVTCPSGQYYEPDLKSCVDNQFPPELLSVPLGNYSVHITMQVNACGYVDFRDLGTEDIENVDTNTFALEQFNALVDAAKQVFSSYPGYVWSVTFTPWDGHSFALTVNIIATLNNPSCSTETGWLKLVYTKK